jgi:hypothetical protein
LVSWDQRFFDPIKLPGLEAVGNTKRNCDPCRMLAHIRDQELEQSVARTVDGSL